MSTRPFHRHAPLAIAIPDLQVVRSSLQALTATLAPHLVGLGPDSMKAMSRMGPKSVDFVRRALTYAQMHPAYAPFVDVDEFAGHLEAVALLRELEQGLAGLLASVQSSALVASNESYAAALSCYRSFKAAVQEGLPGAVSMVEDLSRRFPGRPSVKTKSSELAADEPPMVAEASTDVERPVFPPASSTPDLQAPAATREHRRKGRKEAPVLPGDRRTHREESPVVSGDGRSHRREASVVPGDRRSHQKESPVVSGDGRPHPKEQTSDLKVHLSHVREQLCAPEARTTAAKARSSAVGASTTAPQARAWAVAASWAAPEATSCSLQASKFSLEARTAALGAPRSSLEASASALRPGHRPPEQAARLVAASNGCLETLSASPEQVVDRALAGATGSPRG